eukprot:440588-Pelagomonas_calceolata.AAC.3
MLCALSRRSQAWIVSVYSTTESHDLVRLTTDSKCFNQPFLDSIASAMQSVAAGKCTSTKSTHSRSCCFGGS